jgi:alpha-1,2-mannosyltransferase
MALAFNLCVFGFALWVSLSNWFPPLTRPSALALVLMTCTVSAPLQHALYLNQPQILIVGLILLALVSVDRGDERLGGLLLGIASAIKLTPIVFAVYWLAAGKRIASVTTLLTITVIMGVGILWLGVPAHVDFAASLRQMSTLGVPAANNQSLVAALLRSQLPIAATRDWRTWSVPASVSAVNIFVGVAVLTWIGWRVRHAQRARDRMQLASLTWLLLLMATPISWSHYYLGLLLPTLVAWSSNRQAAKAAAILVAVVNSVPVTMFALATGWVSIHLASAMLLVPLMVPRGSTERTPSDVPSSPTI